jgi:hypothetical protein
VQLLNTQASANSLLSCLNRLTRQVGTATEVIAMGLTEIPPHPEFSDDGWRLEGDFIDSIRGIKPVTLTNFDDGVRYMEFVEAVTLSMHSGEAASLPL